MPAPSKATDAEILALIREGLGNHRIARELHCDASRVRRLRKAHGLPNAVQQPLPLEEKWRAYTRPVDGGHLEWTGPRAGSTGTPQMRHGKDRYSGAAVAFRIHHGRPPRGYVIADCGYPHCVAPEHVLDETGRWQKRLEVREARGLGPIPEQCPAGHDMSRYARLEPDGIAYCQECKRLDKRAARGECEPRSGRPASLEEAFRRHTEPVDGGHVRWTGPTPKGLPTFWFARRPHTAYRVAFRLEHGRDPDGLVKPGCDRPQCVAGPHLEDRPMRKRTDSLFTAIFGDVA
jgi:hypothetical protein